MLLVDTGEKKSLITIIAVVYITFISYVVYGIDSIVNSLNYDPVCEHMWSYLVFSVGMVIFLLIASFLTLLVYRLTKKTNKKWIGFLISCPLWIFLWGLVLYPAIQDQCVGGQMYKFYVITFAGITAIFLFIILGILAVYCYIKRKIIRTEEEINPNII